MPAMSNPVLEKNNVYIFSIGSITICPVPTLNNFYWHIDHIPYPYPLLKYTLFNITKGNRTRCY